MGITVCVIELQCGTHNGSGQEDGMCGFYGEVGKTSIDHPIDLVRFGPIRHFPAIEQAFHHILRHA